MRKPILAIKLKPQNYAGLVNLGNSVVIEMTGNSNFTTPVPALATMTAAITAADTALTAWGTTGNRGSHADLVVLREKALTLMQLLKALSQYVQNTAQLASGHDYAGMASILVSSGFALKQNPSPQGKLEAVQNFHRFISRQLAPNQVKLKWKLPLNVSSLNNVKGNKVMRGATEVFSAAVEIAATTRTSFIDTNTSGVSQTWFYWVVPFNSAGDGVPSNAVMTTVLSN